MAEKPRAIIRRTLVEDNQVLRAILGICSSLAVTNTMNAGNPMTEGKTPLLTLERFLFRLIGAGFVLLTLTLASGN